MSAGIVRNAMTPNDNRAATLPRQLTVLVPLIREALHTAEITRLEHYREAGALLIEAKARVVHGEWRPWIKKHFGLSIDTAQLYMRLAQKPNAFGFSSLREAKEATRKKPRAQPRRSKSEHAPEGDDAEQVGEIAAEIIDQGYRALARRYHPDKGGSSTDMARLNRARSALHRCLRQWADGG